MSIIDDIQRKAKEEEEKRKKKFQEDKARFEATVEERQRLTGQGEYGKGGSKDVRARAIAEAEAKVAAERQYYVEQPKQSLTVGQRRKDGSRVTSVTGERPPQPTEADIQARVDEKDVKHRTEELIEKQRQTGSYSGPEIQKERRIQEQKRVAHQVQAGTYPSGAPLPPKEQREAETEATFEAYRKAKEEAKAQGYDISSGSFRTTRAETPEGIESTITLTGVGGVTLTPEKKKELQKEAQQEAIFETYRRLKEQASAEGYDVSGASFRVRGDTVELTGVSGYKPKATVTATQGLTIVGGPSLGEEKTRLNRSQLTPEQLAFVKSQEVSGEQKYSGYVSANPATGEISYYFTDIEVSKQYRAALLANRKENYEIRKFNEKQEANYQADKDTLSQLATKSGYVLNETRTVNPDGTIATSLELIPDMTSTSGNRLIIVGTDDTGKVLTPEQSASYRTALKKEADTNDLVYREHRLKSGTYAVELNRKIYEYKPDVGEQIYSGLVKYPAEILGGLIELPTVIGKKVGVVDPNTKTVGEELASIVRKAGGFETKAEAQKLLYDLTGQEGYKQAELSARRLAKSEGQKPSVSPFGLAVQGALETFKLIPGADKEEISRGQREFLKGVQERPIEFASATVIDFLTFGTAGAKKLTEPPTKTTTPARTAERTTEGAPIKFTATTVEGGVTTGVRKVTKPAPVPIDLATFRGTFAESGLTRKITSEFEKAKPTSRIKPDLSEKVTIASKFDNEYARPIIETDVIVKRPSRGGSGGKPSTSGGPDGRGFKNETVDLGRGTGSLVDLGTGKPSGGGAKKPPSKPDEGDTGTGAKFGDAEVVVSKSGTIQIVRKKKGPSQQTETKTVEEEIAKQSEDYFKTPEGIKRVEDEALKDQQLVMKQEKTEKLVEEQRTKQKKLEKDQEKVQKEIGRLAKEEQSVQDALNAERSLPDGGNAQVIAELEARLAAIRGDRLRAQRLFDRLEAERLQFEDSILAIRERRKLKRHDFFGARQRTYERKIKQEGKGVSLEDRGITKITAPGLTLGFKGETGYERVLRHRKRLKQQEDQFLRFPEETLKVKIDTKQKPSQTLKIEDLIGLRQEQKPKTTTRQKPAEFIIFKQDEAQKFKFDDVLALKFDTKLKDDLKVTQRQKTTTRTDIPLLPRTDIPILKTPALLLPPKGGGSLLASKLEKDYGIGIKPYAVENPLFPSFSLKKSGAFKHTDEDLNDMLRGTEKEFGFDDAYANIDGAFGPTPARRKGRPRKKGRKVYDIYGGLY